MFASLGQFVARRPWQIIVAWIVVAVVVILTAPKLTSTTDEADFLPGHYESIKAIDLQTKAFPDRTDVGAIIVFDRKDGAPLTAADSAEVAKIAATLQSKKIKQFGPIVASPPSSNKLVQT